jgi:hypothetical protein
VTRLLNNPNTKAAGVRGLPRLGVWGFDPQKTHRSEAAADGAKRRKMPRRGGPWGSIRRWRGSAGPRGEVPGGVRVSQCAPKHCVAR